MKRARFFGCLLGLSALVMPARFALGADEVPAPDPTPFLGVWSVAVTPDQASVNAGRNAFNDFVLFEADGLFTAEAFGPMGFGRAAYALTDLGGGVLAFSTSMTNDTQGTVVWNGVRQNGVIVGSIVWTKADASVSTYEFRAEPMDDD